MKFQPKDLKSKKAITIIVIVIAVIAGFTIYHKHEEQDFMKDLKVEFTGYSGQGKAVVTDGSNLSTFKKVARFEAKKSGFDSSAAKTIINSASTVDDLSSGQVFDSLKLKDPSDAEIYAHHMDSTKLKLSRETNLQNGDKISASIMDESVDPYFEPKSKSFKVSGTKKANTVSVQDYKKFMTLTGTGTNHHSAVSVKINKKAIPQIDTYGNSIEWLMHIRKGNGYYNGQKFSTSEKSLAKLLNKQSITKGYIFVGRPNHKITLTVSGLKNNRRNVSNIYQVNNQVMEAYQDDKSEHDPDHLQLTSAMYNPKDSKLTLIYKAHKNDYYTSYISCDLKGNLLTSDDEPLQNNEFDSEENLPSSDVDILDSTWNDPEEYSENIIDINI